MTSLVILSILAYHATTSVPFDVMKEIAFCESSLNPLAKNSRSTATGIFQFTKPTWEWAKCEGERTDPTASAKCFVKLFPKYPHYWQCKQSRKLVSIQ